MNKTGYMGIALGLLCAVVGGAVVWSYMTFTIVERAELADLKADQTKLGECVVEKSNVLSTAQDAKAEAERLKAK